MRTLLDLLFPATCAGCDRGGALVCDECARLLRAPARARPPTPAPPLLPTPYAVADYAGSVRALVLRYKEHERVVLARPLGVALATSTFAAAATGGRAPVAIVPVPSSPAARRRRGFDPVLRLARSSLATLRTAGLSAQVVPMLGHVRGVRDSAGLSSVQRAANLDRAFVARADVAARLGDRLVVVVDDVVTTGATLSEAARALRAVGVRVAASAVVAATVRTAGLAQKGLHNDGQRHYGGCRAPTSGGTAWTSS